MGSQVTIFSYQLFHATIRSSTPIILALIGAIISKQANIFNIGIEGIMLFGAFTAITISVATGSWIIALLAAILVGMVISLLMGLAHLKFRSSILVLGFSLNAMALGATRLLMQRIFGHVGSYTPRDVTSFPIITIKALDNHPVLSSLFSGYSLMEILAIILILLLWYVLYRTKIGLHLRSVGLNEVAAQTAGINAYRTKLAAIVVSGVFAGMAGAHLSLGYTTMFAEGMTSGRGFMANAAMNFGNGNPITLCAGLCCLGSVNHSVQDCNLQACLPSSF